MTTPAPIRQRTPCNWPYKPGRLTERTPIMTTIWLWEGLTGQIHHHGGLRRRTLDCSPHTCRRARFFTVQPIADSPCFTIYRPQFLTAWAAAISSTIWIGMTTMELLKTATTISA